MFRQNQLRNFGDLEAKVVFPHYFSWSLVQQLYYRTSRDYSDDIVIRTVLCDNKHISTP